MRFRTELPQSIRIAESSASGQSIFEYEPKGKAVEAFKTLVYKKKFEKENREWKSYKFTAHDLRTTFATMRYDAGVDLHTVKRWMGHSNIETTLAIYTKLTEERRTESTK